MTDASTEVVRREAFATIWAEGRPAWPSLALERDAFVAWATGHVAPEIDPRGLHAADLYLVGACLTGVAKAARAFIEGPLAEAEGSVLRVLPSPTERAELMQELAIHLLTPGESADPRLGHYDGRAPLRAWLRMTAVRRALNKTRGKTKHVELEEAALDRASAVDPELSTLRRIHRDDIAAIFREATAQIPADDRALLRLHYIQGSTLAELAAIHRTSRSSMHRRLEGVREALMERIARMVRERIRLDDSQQGSMLRIFQSDLRDTLGRLLRE